MTFTDRRRELWGRAWFRLPVKIVVIPLCILFALLLLFDWVVMPLWTRHGDEFAAPNLVGRDLAGAQEILSDADLSMEIIERRFSPEFSDGTILEQRPQSGAPVKTGRVFKVVVSRGSELIAVPRVRGFTVRQAELILTEAGFTVGGRAPADDPSVPVGTVAGTIPDAGGRLPRGTVVHLLVNEAAQTWAWCPNLVGKNIEEARAILRERNLLVGRVDRRFDDKLLPGTVIEQSHTPGEELRVGTEINLVISRDR
ncbi:MAG TPA: PASTA domain-containing protein [Acidobacteriota bacterium]|nr:PASTA domain-containing protein [Acidobacteriota bacterium]